MLYIVILRPTFHISYTIFVVLCDWFYASLSCTIGIILVILIACLGAKEVNFKWFALFNKFDYSATHFIEFKMSTRSWTSVLVIFTCFCRVNALIILQVVHWFIIIDGYNWCFIFLWSSLILRRMLLLGL